ncbi:MAG: SpoIID/LytB domain-containing protein [Phycisphaerales bacterium]|nr:SpoIID/LytB domain-containing protein [Phycisphaerales bacterium]
MPEERDDTIQPDGPVASALPPEAVAERSRRRAWVTLLASACFVVILSSTACSLLMRSSSREARIRSLSDVSRLEGEPDIRIRIESLVEGIDLKGAALTEGGVPVLPGRIVRSDSGWRIQPSGPEGAVQAFGGDELTLVPGADGLIRIGEWTVRGRVCLDPRPDLSPGIFDIIEYIPVEQYLPGVLAREFYASWSLDAFKAQAIAARSYALHERLRRLSIGSHFDVEATTRDQVYGGITDNETAIRAVRETSGIVLVTEGHILRAYYSSTCGGRPASAADTWPTGPGFEYNLDRPLQAASRDHYCQFSPLHEWRVERSLDDLSRRFRVYGREHGLGMKRLTGIRSITVARHNGAGRPSHFKVTDTSGESWEYSGETIRLACNDGTDKTLPGITRDTRVHSSDCTFEVRGNRVVITGRGFGHGVGLCQYGAEGMSRAGLDAGAIILSFYPGATLQRAY